MRIELNDENLGKFFSGEIRHDRYVQSVQLAERLSRHAQGKKDGYGDLISERRPGEAAKILEYRKKIIVAKTKQTFSSVITELGKIRKADDWNVYFDPKKIPSIVPEGKSLKQYLETDYPKKFGSLTNWTFSVLLNKYAQDAHAGILIMPLEKTDATTVMRPFPFLFGADQVIGYEEDEYAVLKSKKMCTYNTEEGKSAHDGQVFYVATKTYVRRYEQANAKGDFRIAENYPVNFGYLPFRLTKGVVSDTYDDEMLWESRFMSMAESFDECIREYSDLQAAIVQHLHPEKWIYSNQKCTAKGCESGKVFTQGNIGGEGSWSECSACNGTGTKVAGPFSTYVVTSEIGEKQIPTPPGGYFDKPGVAEMIKLQDERVNNHQFEALASINMQFLHKVPMKESGIAKEVDRDSLNTFVNSTSEDLVGIMDWTAKCSNDWMFSYLIKDELQRDEMLPKIHAPTNFDILSSGYLIEEIKKAREGKVSPMIVNHLEIQYTNKMFNADSSVRDELVGLIELDPLSGYSQDDKNSMLQNNGISEIDFIVSCNIREFVRKAIEEDENFMEQDYTEKMEKMRELAAEKKEETKASNQIENPLDEGNEHPETKPVPFK